MGEPVPGDFPDPIYVKTANVLLKATQVGSAGDYLRYNTTGTKAWEVINTTLITVQGSITGEGFVQSQQDFNSTGIADAVANAGAFGPGSWFYGLANGTINPNDYVMLGRIGTQFGFKNTRDITPVDVVVATNVGTVDFGTIRHGLKVGDRVTLSGFTPADMNDADNEVLSITDEFIVTIALTAADATSTVQGLVSTIVTANFAHAQFIKKSGDTFSDGAVLNDTCVFSMLTGGQAIV